MRGTIKPNLFVGAKVVLMPRFEPRAFLTALAQQRATFCGGVPAIFSLTLPHAELIRSLDFSALTLISANPFVRGFVSGFGLVHLIIGIKDIIEISQARRRERAE